MSAAEEERERASYAAQLLSSERALARSQRLVHETRGAALERSEGALARELGGKTRRRDEAFRVAQSRLLNASASSAASVAPSLASATHAAAHDGLSSLAAFGFRSERSPDIAARVAARVSARQGEVLGRFAAEQGRVAMRELGVARRAGADPIDAMVRAAVAVRDQGWQLDRIAATETSFAFNAARQEALTEWSRTEPGVWKRWTEKIDLFGHPLDSRVAFDSQAMHGQVMPSSAMFKMPEDAKVDARWWGREWEFPPNRPHDRAVLTPWRHGSRIPAWTWRNGAKVTL